MKKLFHVSLAAMLAVILILPAYASPSVFEDVPSGYWAEADIRYVAERKLFTGISATRFKIGRAHV